MARPSKTRALGVWMNGERVGTWTLRANGAEEFSYTDEWLESGAARPISLSMPLAPTGTLYRGDVVAAFFDNLLPDSREIRERIQTRFGTASMRPFDLLAESAVTVSARSSYCLRGSRRRMSDALREVA